MCKFQYESYNSDDTNEKINRLSLNMKNILLLIILPSLLFFSCKKSNSNANKQNTRASIVKVLSSMDIAFKDSGWAYLKNDSRKVIIYQQTNKSSVNTYNRLIVLMLDNPASNYVKSDLPNDTLFFWYTRSQRQIITYSVKSDKVIILALKDTDGLKLVKLFKNNKDLNEKTEYALGYGLSVANDSHKISDFLNLGLNQKAVYTVPSYIPSLAGGGSSCSLGGTGASQCSVTNGTLGGGAGCSVTCSAGYYACCNDDTVICNCVANPTKKN